MRADAQKNQQRLVDAATELILEIGGEPKRDAVAERAGVGIGTLYRHFPDQQSLLLAVARSALERTIGEGEAIIANTTAGIDTLRQYMHAAVDSGIGVVNIIHPLIQNPYWPDLKARASALMRSIVDCANQDGRLRSHFSERDIVLATIRFARPLAIGLSMKEEREIAHRHLDCYINGLCTG